MRKIILLLCFVPFIGFSQEKIDSYHNSAANKEYNISITQPNKKGVFTYWIECKSIDSRSTQAVLFIDSDKIQDFITYINYLKEIHSKWSDTAKANRVNEISKAIDYKSKNYNGAFSYGEWNFDNSIYLNATFKILIGEYYTIINSGELKSISNQFIKSDGFMFSFNKDSDFEDLIKKLNNEESIKILEIAKSKDDLFKN
jgi:hypothetical protein